MSAGEGSIACCSSSLFAVTRESVLDRLARDEDVVGSSAGAGGGGGVRMVNNSLKLNDAFRAACKSGLRMSTWSNNSVLPATTTVSSSWQY